MHMFNKPTRAIVEHHAVQMPRADGELEEVASRESFLVGLFIAGGCCEVGGEQREGAPGDHGHGLDAEDQGVRGEVARVGEGVLFPELGEEGLGGWDGGVVEDEVACVGVRRG